MYGPSVSRPLGPQYVAFWSASTISSFGSAVSILALQVIAVDNLNASATEVGWLNGIRWLPYLVFGLLAGAIIDRHRRKPILVGTDLGRGVLLVALPVLYALGWLNVSWLLVVTFAFGVLTLFSDAASQSALPGLVPREDLTRANARLEQGDAVARTVGPVLAGALIRVVGAPVAVLVDAASYLASGVLIAGIKMTESTPRPHERATFRADMREGVAWVYRHRNLAPMALTSHVRFFFMSMLSTVFVVYALRDLSVGAFGLGVGYAFGGVGAVVGGALADQVSRRLQVGWTLILTRMLVPVVWGLLLFAQPDRWALIIIVVIHFGTWVVLGIESPTEQGYRQCVTPDRLLGRMNATIRSLNWGTTAIGAPVGGILADSIGFRPTIWIAIAGLAVAALSLAVSPFRGTRLYEAASSATAPTSSRPAGEG